MGGGRSRGGEENRAEGGKMCVTGERLALPYLPPAAAATGSQMRQARAAVSERSLYQRHTGTPRQIQTQQENTPGFHYLFKTPISMQERSKIICNFVDISSNPEEMNQLHLCCFLARLLIASFSYQYHFPTLIETSMCLSFMNLNTETVNTSTEVFQCIGLGQDKSQLFTLYSKKKSM